MLLSTWALEESGRVKSIDEVLLTIDELLVEGVIFLVGQTTGGFIDDNEVLGHLLGE